MQDAKMGRWVATAGFVTLAAILILEGLAIYRLDMGSMHVQAPMVGWSETVMRILFGKTI
jgi:hypothetical protein